MSAKSKAVLTPYLDDFFLGIAEMWRFSLSFFRERVQSPYEFRETIRQCYRLGVSSLPLPSLETPNSVLRKLTKDT